MKSAPCRILRRCRFAWFVALGLAAGVCHARSPATPLDVLSRLPPGLETLVDVHLAPLELALWNDAADGQLDQHSLLAAALVASGVDHPPRMQHYLDQYHALLRDLPLHTAAEPKQQAAVLLETLHRQLLVGRYRADASSLALLFDRGDYNCISSLILFMALARDIGLDVEAVEVPGHAYARLRVTQGHWIRVETTCPDWFEAEGNSRREESALEHLAGQAIDRNAARPLSPVGMVATLYYNRGVDLLNRGNFPRALSANALAMSLDSGNGTAYSNLLAAVNNWALDLCSQGDYDQAVDLLRRGLRAAPQHGNFQTNYVAVHERWLIHLCLQGEHREALQRADRLLGEAPGHQQFRLIRLDVLLRWAEHLASRGRYAESQAVLEAARRDYPDRSEPAQVEARLRRLPAVAPGGGLTNGGA